MTTPQLGGRAPSADVMRRAALLASRDDGITNVERGRWIVADIDGASSHYLTAVRVKQGNIRLGTLKRATAVRCSCPAGHAGTLCYHALALLARVEQGGFTIDLDPVS